MGTLHFISEQRRNRRAAEYIHNNERRRRKAKDRFEDLAFCIALVFVLGGSMLAALILDGVL